MQKSKDKNQINYNYQSGKIQKGSGFKIFDLSFIWFL
jgi:hypothetical protein